jgi:hypothetical protein
MEEATSIQFYYRRINDLYMYAYKVEICAYILSYLGESILKVSDIFFFRVIVSPFERITGS